MTYRRAALAFTAALALTALASATPASAAPASATVSPHCLDGGYCLFSGTEFTGAKAVVPPTRGCHPVSDLGFPTARSAARGYGDDTGLVLYTDTTCTTTATAVYNELPTTTANSYRLLPIPT